MEPSNKRDSSTKSLVFKSTGDHIGEGDTELLLDFLPPELAEGAFEKLRSEVAWSVMLHHGGEVPRLVAVEGEITPDGSIPIYRHPSDESPPLNPFSPTVSLIRSHVERVVGHPVNHVLIQYYRTGNDYISEHSDKTIDVDRNSKIVNVSLGAQRTMILRRKKEDSQPDSSDTKSVTGTGTGIPPRDTERINLPNNSIFIMGLRTNQSWVHSIRQDNRPPPLKSPAELAFQGQRISLTFRKINTFLTKDSSSPPNSSSANHESNNGWRIWGQGATAGAKSPETARPVINGDKEASEKMIYAFSKENKLGNKFDWEECYGAGFDVLHFSGTGQGIEAPVVSSALDAGAVNVS